MTSRRRFLLQLGAGVVVLASAPTVVAAPDDLVLVLNAKNTGNPDAGLAKRLFVGEALFWPGNVPVHPLVRPADHPAGHAFYRAIGVTPSRFKRIWQEKQLSGQGVTPETIDAIAAVLAKVAADPGGVAVALAAEVPASSAGIRVVPFA